MKVRTGTESENNNYTKIAQRTNAGEKRGEKTILASKYRAAKAGHISAKGNGGKKINVICNIFNDDIFYVCKENKKRKQGTVINI